MDGTTAPALHSLKGQVSDEEWRARCDLAALYRLAAREGWDDMIFTHISARVPGPEAHFLINPYGWFFEEITASCLVKVDLDGAIAQQTSTSSTRRAHHPLRGPRGARRRPLVHPPAHRRRRGGVGAAGGPAARSPSTRWSCCRNWLHDYEASPEPGRAERIVAELGDKSAMLLRNHGTMDARPHRGRGVDDDLLPRARLRATDLALSAGRSGC